MAKNNKAARIISLLKKYPEWSNKHIAATAAVSANYVWKLRRDVMHSLPLDLTSDMEVARSAEEAPEVAPDMVNHPPHYTDGGIETIDYIQAKLTPEEFRGYCLGNSLKYVSRAGMKGNFAEDLSKARWYLDRITNA